MSIFCKTSIFSWKLLILWLLIKSPIFYKRAGLKKLDFTGLVIENSGDFFKFLKIPQGVLYKKHLLGIEGVGYAGLVSIEKYLETHVDCCFYQFTSFQKYIFFYYFLYVKPTGLINSQRILFNIWILHYLFSYKGWRHFFGLPANGQRTWSNNKTQFRLKNKLKEYQTLCFKKKFGINTNTNLKISFFAEYVNLFWFLEWNEEWLSANQTFKKSSSKKKYFKLKINYRHLLNVQVTTPFSLELKKKKRNRKKVKSEFTIGFDSLYVVSLFSKKKYLFKHLF